MASIVRPAVDDAELLSNIAKQSFIESHGRSAPPPIAQNYANEKFSYELIKKELADPKNIYYIIYHEEKAAGYSKIVFDVPHENIAAKNITKLDRLYLLEEFLSLKLGAELMHFNIELSKQQGQAGMWLYVWKENHRAFRFYQKLGFVVIGSYDFHLSETHVNPNHQMYLEY